ncbi:hypothetical protein CE91St68_13450 [Methanobrevibacter smithii]|nr:hypothetical protein CE91St68_13450 [Methanobrevibacter smithii]
MGHKIVFATVNKTIMIIAFVHGPKTKSALSIGIAMTINMLIIPVMIEVRIILALLTFE